MVEEQFSFSLEGSEGSAATTTPELRDEIARAWGLPLGERVEVRFRDGQLDALTGKLELLAAPDFPWDPRQALQLRSAGYHFSSREIESWSKA